MEMVCWWMAALRMRVVSVRLASTHRIHLRWRSTCLHFNQVTLEMMKLTLQASDKSWHLRLDARLKSQSLFMKKSNWWSLQFKLNILRFKNLVLKQASRKMHTIIKNLRPIRLRQTRLRLKLCYFKLRRSILKQRAWRLMKSKHRPPYCRLTKLKRRQWHWKQVKLKYKPLMLKLRKKKFKLKSIKPKKFKHRLCAKTHLTQALKLECH